MKLTISAETPVFEISLGESATYHLAFPLTSVIKAEEKLGRSLKSFRDWLLIEPKEFPAIIECGLLKLHSETAESAARAIAESLSTEALDELHLGLCRLNFPKAMARAEELQQQETEKETVPNAQSGSPQGN